MHLISAETAALSAGAAIADGRCLVALPTAEGEWAVHTGVTQLDGVDGAHPVRTLHDCARLLLQLADVEMQMVTGDA